MARLLKYDYFLTYHLGTETLSGDTEVSLRNNFAFDEFNFQNLTTLGDGDITFDPFTLSADFGYVIMDFIPTGVSAGEYVYDCRAFSVNEELLFTVHVTVLGESEPEPEDPDAPVIIPEPAVKYEIENTSITGDIYLLEILEQGFEGVVTEIRGRITHDYATRKDIMHPIVASSLDITLEADEDLTLSDLYTEEESKFKVRLKRNGQIIFYGILKPDGIWEDFVSNRWEISMDAMDGLSILKDLSFVKDSGAPYYDEITQFDALKQCLHRIGYDLPINISTTLPTYEGFTGTDTILNSVKMNADRFYQDEKKENIMDCEEVLKSVLEIYSATIIQMNGEWWVFRAIDVSDTMNFYRYDGETKTDIVWNAALEIGSHTNNFPIFHCGANQKKSISPSAQAFRVNYKYGTVRSVNENPYIKLNSGLSANGYNINNPDSGVFRNDPPNGINAKIVLSDSSYFNNKTLLIENIGGDFIQENELVNVNFTFENNGYAGSGTSYIGLHYEIATDLYQLSQNRASGEIRWILKTSLDWSVEFWKFMQYNGKNGIGLGAATLLVELPPFPEDSNIKIKVFRDVTYSADYSPDYRLVVKNIEVVPLASGNLKGEFHTAQRLTRISSVTKADKVVNNGDSLSDIYYGTLYKASGEPTELWPTKPLLQLMAEDALRIAPRPMYFFEGNVYGYFPYLANVLINNVPGKFQISKYSFDTQTNVNNTNFKEFDNVVLVEGVDYRYEFDYDYGSTTKVTIK